MAHVLERKTRAILAYLVVTQKLHHRRALWRLFLEETKNPAASFRWHLSRIRRQFGDNVLITDGDEVGVNTAVLTSDLFIFQEVMQQPESYSLGEIKTAVSHYAGDFLDDITLRNSPEFDLWVLGERARLQQLFERGCLYLAYQLIQNNQFDDALPVAQRLTQINPLLEEAHYLLIWLYATVGQPQTALTLFAQCQRLLAELAVEPSQKLVDLRTAISDNLPLPNLQTHRASALTPADRAFDPLFVGREAELQQVKDLIARPASHTVLVESAAGLGKTALIQQCLNQSRDPILKGNCYESTRSISYQPWLPILENQYEQLTRAQIQRIPAVWQSQLAKLLPHRFNAVNTSFDAPDQLYRAIAYLLLEVDQRSKIVFIEDLHWADAGSLELFKYLTAYHSSVTLFLFGSYRTEEIASDSSLLKLPSQANVTVVTLLPMTVSDIEKLVKHDLPLIQGDVAAFVQKIAEDTRGSPLFVKEILHELIGYDYLPDALPIPKSLQTITTHRLQRIPSSSRQVLEAIAILDHPAQFWVAQQISNRTEGETVLGIEDGLNWHLLVARPAAEFDFSHQLIRQVILGELGPIRRQRLHFRAADCFAGQRVPSATLVYHWERAGEAEKTAVYALKAGDEAVKKVAVDEAISFYEKARHHFLDDDTQNQYEATCRLVKLLSEASMLEKLPRYLEELENLAFELDQPKQLAETAVFRAQFHTVGSQFDAAQQAVDDGLAWAEAGGEMGFETELRLLQSTIFLNQGRYDLARPNIEAVLNWYQKQRNRQGQIKAIVSLSNILLNQGHQHEAIKLLNQAIKLSRQIKDPFAESKAISLLSHAHWNLGNYEEIERISQDGIALSEKIGDRSTSARFYNSLAGVYIHRFDYELAIDNYQKALTICEALNIVSGIAVYNNNIGATYMSLKDTKRAFAYLETAVESAKKANNPRLEALALYTLGHTYRMQANHSRAKEVFAEALEIRRQIGLAGQVYITLIQLVQTLLDLDDNTTVKEVFLETQAQFEVQKDELSQYSHRLFHFIAYQYFEREGNVKLLKEHIQQAYDLFQAHLAPLDEAGQTRALADENNQALISAWQKHLA
ncbi:MAG: tetratricopeptide repeat protein [Chloroflexota bacterium]